jgi:hypothetical protein
LDQRPRAPTPQLIRLVVPLNAGSLCLGYPAHIWRLALSRTISRPNRNLLHLACPTIVESVRRASSSLAQNAFDLATVQQPAHLHGNSSSRFAWTSAVCLPDLTSPCICSSSTPLQATQHSRHHVCQKLVPTAEDVDGTNADDSAKTIPVQAGITWCVLNMLNR